MIYLVRSSYNLPNTLSAPTPCSCCTQCGKVLEEDAFSTDITFHKDAAGESTVVGQFVNESGVARGIGRIHGGRVYAFQADSHEKAQQRGRQDISQLVNLLNINNREEVIEGAHRLYRLALQRGFTRGRRTNQVAAACLYLVCRQDGKPFLLIDFSDALQVNVFTLGGVFLQLTKLLRLEEHPMFSKPVDPSTYIPRFADKLSFKAEKLNGILTLATRLVASMKRDWIQTGRRPSGICGAALYIASHVYGDPKTKREVVAVVHIGEHTLAKRLSEFSATEAARLTQPEFESYDKSLIEIQGLLIENAQPEAAEADGGGGEEGYGREFKKIGCEHLAAHTHPHFARGMCKGCFIAFVEGTGGLHDGSNPPAYRQNRKREQKELLALPPPENADEEAERAAIRDEMQKALQAEELAPFAAIFSGRAAIEEEEERLIEAEEKKKRRKPARKGKRGGYAALLAKAAALMEEKDAEEDDEANLDSAVAALQHNAVEEAMGNLSSFQNAAMKGITEFAGAVALLNEPTCSALPREQQQQQVDEDDQILNLSDIGDDEIAEYLADEEEIKFKEEIWNMMNRDWMEKQAAKKAALDAAQRAQEEQRAAMEAAAAAGVAYKRGRGRPLGSKTKPKPEINLPPADNAVDAALRMMENKKLSSKINYTVFRNLLSEDMQVSNGAAAPTAKGEPRLPSIAEEHPPQAARGAIRGSRPLISPKAIRKVKVEDAGVENKSTPSPHVLPKKRKAEEEQSLLAAKSPAPAKRAGALGSLKDDWRSKLVGAGGSKGVGLTPKGILGNSKTPLRRKK